jgi:4-hydroxy-3-methylbut-2-enyl diphosphate reductase
MVTAPDFENVRIQGVQHYLIFSIIFTLSLARTFIYDLRDMQKDQVLGKETLPIALGKTRSLWSIGLLITFCIFAVGLSSYLSANPIGLRDQIIMITALGYPVFYWWFYHHRFSAGKPRLDVRPEFSFFLVGLLTIL